jgi:hypothetical protein
MRRRRRVWAIDAPGAFFAAQRHFEVKEMDTYIAYVE